ncbi:hypothetical protein ACET7F_20680 [Aeromonas veronii]
MIKELALRKGSDIFCYTPLKNLTRLQANKYKQEDRDPAPIVDKILRCDVKSKNQATTIKTAFFMQVNAKLCLMAYKGSIAILWQFLSKIIPDFCMQIVMVLSCTQTLIIKKWRFIKQGLKLMKLLSQCQKSVPLYGNEHFCAAIWWQTLLPNDLLSLFTIQTTQKKHKIMKINLLDMQ